MPGLVQAGNRRKRPSRAMSSDDDELSDSSSKRGRLANDASVTPSAETSFQPGSIIRVKLKNFVTYTAAEFHLGPSLNMVIGPNGTGKSTLVCAICLGLGWSSEHLGRAKDLGEFVKHGCDLAEIEIELAAGPNMARNPIVRRQIRKADNKTQYWLNGKSVPQKKVSELAKEFLIQIDNLCQFLPQDRVVEFAKMSDVDRLRETQRAAAPQQMVEWHDQLKEYGTQEKELETTRLAHEQQLKKLENQQSTTKDDVDRWNERQALLVKSKVMHKVRPIIECNLRKVVLKQAKADIKVVQRELVQLEAEVEPVRQAQAEAATYRDQIEQVVKTRKNRLDVAKAQADQLTRKIAKAQEDIAALEASVEGEANSKKARERDIIRLKADIARLDRQRQEQPVECDTDGWNQQNTEFRTQISAAERRISEIEDKIKEMIVQGRSLMQEKQMAEAQLQELDTQSGKQASLLSKLSPDTARAWDWFLKNKDSLQLRGEVYGPPVLTCSIPDSRYASAVETQLRHGDFIGITCTNGEDSKTLSRVFTRREGGGLGLHDIHLRTSPKPLSSYRPPVAPENLPHYGFEGYLVDYIRGPDSVIAMLCDNARLNRTAFASKTLSDEQHTAASASPIQKWVGGREVFMITTRKEYGASSTSVNLLKEARVFVDQPVNAEEKRQYQETIKRTSRDLEEMKEEHGKMKEKKKADQDQISELKTGREQAQADHEQRRRAVAQWQGLPRQIKQKEAEMDSKLQDNAQTTSRIRESRVKMREASLKAASLTIEYAKMITHLRSFLESLTEAEIRLIEARSETKALEIENKTILDRQTAKQNEIVALQKENDINRKAYEILVRNTQQMLRGLTPAENEIVNEYRVLASVEELENEIAAVTARLDMMAEGNPGAIKAYENREHQIRDCRKKLDQAVLDLDETKQEIVEIRGKWEPQLDALMSRISDAFSHNFEQIGCAGEVSVYKDEEDFDKWSVRIKVRFREGEPLSILDSQRQSGGERAVSTIFYLMALQDLAQSPFRVVDEINQGMDPRNERMVHGRMVDIACQERTSQYFLVTPKLLTGLKTHPKMAVHVIYSGEHVPDSQNVKDEWNLNEMAKLAIRRKNASVAAAA